MRDATTLFASYTIAGLYAAGLRFVDDYSRDEAVAQYLQLHPAADAAAIRAELERELAAADR